MVSEEACQRARQVLAAILSKPNRFALADGAGEETIPAALREAVDAFAAGQQTPVLLPWREQAGAPVTWLACAHDISGLRALEAELEAFVGPSYAVRPGGPGPSLLSGRPVTAWLESQQLHAFVLESASAGRDERIAAQWGLYWELLRGRPVRSAAAPRSFAQLRAAFDMALAAGRRRDAEQVLAVMRERHGLTGENRAFLEIRIRAALGRWQEVIGHPRLRDILGIRLPPETAADILEAFYEEHVKPVEASGNVGKLLEVFADEVASVCGALLRGRGGSRRPVVFKSLLLEALSAPSPVPALCADLLAAAGEGAFGAAGPALAERVAALLPRQGIRTAIDAMSLERYEDALAILAAEMDTADVLVAALDCAIRIGDPGIAAGVLGRLTAASAEIAGQVQARRPRLLTDVGNLAARQPPPTLEAQLAVPAVAATAALDVVEHWRETIRSAESPMLAADPAFIDRLVEAMEQNVIDAPPVFDSLLPLWSEWLLEQIPPGSVLVPAYLALVDCLRTRDRLGESELELIRLAFQHSLRAGPDSAAYARIISQIIGVLKVRDDPGGVRWGIAVLDTLAAGACRDPDARLRIAALVVDAAARLGPRVDAAPRRILQTLCNELGMTIDLQPGNEAASAAGLPPDPKARVLLYSLDRLALERAVRLLTDMFPLSRFDMADDEVCSGRLRSLARTAEWIVFVSRVSKHQPYYCVEQNRSRDSELLHPNGSGTTRLVETVVERAAR